MTFLEYVARKLLGPPDRYGRWPCPRCGSRTGFGLMPPKPRHKDRCRCHACTWLGDAADLLRLARPDLTDWKRDREPLLVKWRAEHARQAGTATTTSGAAAPDGATAPATTAAATVACEGRNVLLPRGCGSPTDTSPAVDEFSDAAGRCAADLAKLFEQDIPATLPGRFAVLGEALAVAERHNLDLRTLTLRAGFEAWKRAADDAHMGSCVNPDCEWACCRLALGQTEDEVREHGRRLRQKHRDLCFEAIRLARAAAQKGAV